MNVSPELTRPYFCRDCGSEVGFRSRRRTLIERFVLPMFLLKPVRCGECFRRDYRLIFTLVHERVADTPRIAAGKLPTASKSNVA
ncbi:MAG TPA: hypothetical protein VH350_17065 [Candidatus Sulfotelmatobacter sp.]|jgi:hypothetical protein|nr:hypothetical protein [Candidatus Sulfotelmatobacter sp.]